MKNIEKRITLNPRCYNSKHSFLCHAILYCQHSVPVFINLFITRPDLRECKDKKLSVARSAHVDLDRYKSSSLHLWLFLAHDPLKEIHTREHHRLNIQKEVQVFFINAFIRPNRNVLELLRHPSVSVCRSFLSLQNEIYTGGGTHQSTGAVVYTDQPQH